jgi:hypothetical protein
MDQVTAERLSLLEERVALLEQSLGVAGPAVAPAGLDGHSAAPASIRRDRLVSVSDLCRHEGEDFVRVAYLWLLRKEADEDGIRHYLHQLDDGADKATIIRELAAEPEARAAEIQLLD